MKINIKNKIAATIVIAIFALSSCVELDVVPTDKFTDPTYWTSQDKAQSVVNMAYSQMNNTDRIFRNERLSDNLYNSYGSDDVRDIRNGQADASTGLFDSYWSDCYSGIKTCHVLLENIDRVDMDESVNLRMKAEARFIRAFLYFELTNWYGDVPFFTEDIDLETASTISRTDKATIIEFIHSELDEIAEILPAKEELSESERGKITSGAAVAFNARVALNNSEWELVKEYTSKLINSSDYGTYSLYGSYKDLFLKSAEYNDEIILDIQQAPINRTWGNLMAYVPFSLNDVQYITSSPTQDLVDAYLMKDGTTWDESTDDAYEGRDPRFDESIIHNGSTISNKGENSPYTVNVDPNDDTNDTRDIIDRENGTRTGYFYRKFYDDTTDAWDAGTSWSCNINFIVIRYADVLLMYAEALNELDEMDAATWNLTIKALRQRAGFDDVPAAVDYPGGSQESLREIIHNERRVELAFEGLRIYDIRRWKTAEDVLNAPARGAKFKSEGGSLTYYTYYDGTFNAGRDYLWAVPRQQILINSNLGQNPNY